MRRISNPHEIISQYYESEGFYEVEWREEALFPGLGTLILSDGKHEIAVNILGEEDVRSRGELQEALIESEKLLEEYEGVVLAIPRKFSSAVDETVLVKYGLGLIVYDNMGAMELISPRIKERKQRVLKTRGEGVRDVKDEELVRLRSELSRVLKILEEMEARMDRLEREQRALLQRIRELEARRPKTEVSGLEEAPRIHESSASSSQLPSYLRDNPWVEILSQRDKR